MNTDSKTPADRNATFFGGMPFTVVFEDGSTESIKIRQLKLAFYQKALSLYKTEDFGLTAFFCERTNASGATADTNWIVGTPPEHKNGVTPDCYEALRHAVREVNKHGFFVFAEREREKELREEQRLMSTMATLPPEAIKAAAEIGASQLTNTAPRPRPFVR